MAIAIDDSAPGPDPRSAATAERQWVFPMGSKADVVMPDGAHRYWSTHCRHGNHDLCKGTCKGCAAPCICGCGCRCNGQRTVEGSTPLDSPAIDGFKVHVADVPDDTMIVGDFGEFARAAREGRPVNLKAFVAIKNVAAPASEVVSVPPPARPLATGGIITDPPLLLVGEDGCALAVPTPADKPAPVPPPVDALLVLLDKWLEEDVDDHTANGWAAIREDIETRARGLWAAGVEEGRRQRDAEIHTSVFTSARLAAAEAGFGPAPESVTVSYDVTTDPQTAFDLGVTEGRRQATEDLTTWLDRLAARLPQYNSELSVCTRRANAQVLGAYERAASIARSGLDRNPHCSTCGDTRGGPRGHETSECTWDMWRWPDLLAVPRDAPATEEITEERCDLPGEHEPHDYDVDAPAGEWRHCDGAAVTEANHG